MNKYNLIPDIEEKIERILRQQNLRPKTTVGDFIKKTKGLKHRYNSICKAPEGKKLVFYARLHNNRDAKRKMLTEVLLARKKIKTLPYLPKYYQGKTEKNFEWLTREYIKDNPLGDNEKLNKKLELKQTKILARVLYQISQTPIPIKHRCINKFNPQRYLDAKKILKKCFEKKIVPCVLYQKAENLLKNNRSLLKKEHRCLAHGDFNLGNVVFAKKGLRVIDWESMQVNNFAFDIGYFFTHSWQASGRFRKTLLKNYLLLLPKGKREPFKTLFRIVSLYFSAGAILHKPKEIKDGFQLKKRKRFLKNLIQNSISGFEHIINA